MENVLNNIEAICLFTGTNGRRGCTGNCLGCFADDFDQSKPMYQGSLTQVRELLSLLPNLKRVNIYGNPDPSVDPEFCNEVAKLCQQMGIQVAFFTNGVRFEKTVNKLIDGLDPSLIHAICFSIDSLDEKKDAAMKGVEISHQSIFQTMENLQRMGIDIQAQFTIWPINMDEDWSAYKEFFESRGVYINGRFGNVENAKGRIQHVPEEKILEIRERHKDVRLSVLLANDEEYNHYLSTLVANDEFRCTDLRKVNVFLTEDEIKAFYFCPMVSTVYPEYYKNIRDLSLPFFHEQLLETGICPIAEYATGFKSATLHHICRYHKNLPKKLLPKRIV